jgi:hypothetical protein
MGKKIVLTVLSNPDYIHLDKENVQSCIDVLNSKIEDLWKKESKCFYGDLYDCELNYYELDPRAFQINNISLEGNKIYGYISYNSNEIGEKAKYEIEVLKNKFIMRYNTESFSTKLKSINGWFIKVEDIKERKIWLEDCRAYVSEGFRNI